MRHRDTRFSNLCGMTLHATIGHKFVTDDEVTSYLQRVEAAKAELRKQTGRVVEPSYTVRIHDDSQAKPF